MQLTCPRCSHLLEYTSLAPRFCSNCGARLFGKPQVMQQFTVIFAGSLDDPSWFRPGMDIYTSSAQPWDHMDPALPKYSTYPPGKSY